MTSRSDWRHDNIGRLLFDSTRRFQERALAIVNQHGYPEMRIAHMATTRHIDLTGTRIADLAVRAGVTKQSMGEMVVTNVRHSPPARSWSPSLRRTNACRKDCSAVSPRTARAASFATMSSIH